ncbi:MAG: nucleotide pyrophosphohydrolase [Candidatus Roizmanbacteria bacterium]|nr:nucleotide pyrophosphohydrolase [Candidatus Roizmanbacteria bacterium]
MNSDRFDKIRERIIQFRDARDWKQFHNPKDVALSMVLEAGEVMEHFQWKNSDEMQDHIIKHRDEIGDELADVIYWVILMCHDLDIDIFEAINRKMEKNEKKYPEDKAKGRHSKYTEL